MMDLNEELQKATQLNTNFKKTNKLLKNEISPLLALENKFNIVKNNNKIDNSNQTGNKTDLNTQISKSNTPFMPELCGINDSIKNICNKLIIKGK